MNIEREIEMGLGRIDITFQNRNREGFFKDLKEMADIKSPVISVECKNLTRDIGNPELDQIFRRLNPNRGMLGFLLCREIEDKDALNLSLRLMAANDHKYIIVLEDKDLIKMLQIRNESGDTGINDFLRRKYEEIIV